MSEISLLWFLAGWVAAAIMPVFVETCKFITIVIKDATRRREMIASAKSRIDVFNGRLNHRQDEIRQTLGGGKNGKKN
jgi:hypothetical protein